MASFMHIYFAQGYGFLSFGLKKFVEADMIDYNC